MVEQKEASFGNWKSPISPDDLATGSTHLSDVWVDQSNSAIYLVEVRPDEDGRGAIVQYIDGQPKDVLPKQYSALTQVHEYGGASMIPRTGNTLIFSDFKTKGVYELNIKTQEVTPITSEGPKVYFADFEARADSDWILAIKEDHHAGKIADIENTLVAINSKTKDIRTVVKGHDFYSNLRFSVDGKRVCYLAWNHPNMPWNVTDLYVGDWKDEEIVNARMIAGGEEKSSVGQPMWSTDGSLFFVDDKSGFWQLYQFKGETVSHVHLKGLEEAEFGEPEWWLGGQIYAMLTPESLVAFVNQNGSQMAIKIDVPNGEWVEIGCAVNEVSFNAMKALSNTSFVVIGSTAVSPQALYKVDIKPGEECEMTLIKSSTAKELPAEYCSPPTSVKFPRDSPEGGFAYGIYRAPTNPHFKGPSDSLPPLIVAVHGGPTWCQGAGLYLRDAFWWTRGYALVQVNYVGSSGYGRDYMNSLNEEWGVADIADVVSCVKYLVDQEMVNPKRIGITGHSAGGYATMQAMCKHPDVWAAGVAESGISDLQLMVAETHKFESEYLGALLWKADTSEEEKKRIIFDRSPINFADQIRAPMLIINGEVDEIVPPNQAQLLADKIKASGGTVDIKIYPGEGHIYSKASSLSDMQVRGEAWFRKYLVDTPKKV